jgi:hypothetical protein
MTAGGGATTPRECLAFAAAAPPSTRVSSSRRRRASLQAAVDGGQPSTSTSTSEPAYPYNGGEGGGRQKATIEHLGGSGAAVMSAAAPWTTSFMINERNLVWNDELKLRLIKVCALFEEEERGEWTSGGEERCERRPA